ncbi:MAG: hypothetical protein ACLFTX_02935, partial [Thiohalospira sp.]
RTRMTFKKSLIFLATATALGVSAGCSDDDNGGGGSSSSSVDPVDVRNDKLTVEKGTQIMGASGSDPSLVITRGSEIDAKGTKDQPIVFGAVDVDDNGEVDSDVTDLSGRGDWGSLVLSGYGKVNAGDDNNQTQTEAVPDGVERWYGGNDNDDSSGTLKYIVMAETGEAFRPDEEVQGITIEGSGSGTKMSHIQVTNSDDDGIEWFGGAADADHVVIQGVTDDSLDMDLGYQGVIQNALVIQGSEHGDRGMETDNNGDDFGATPKSSPLIVNATVLGNHGNEDITMGSMRREGFGGQVFRSVYSDVNAVNNWSGNASGQFSLGCIDVDDEVDEDLEYSDVIFNCSAGELTPADD